jgi:hypothetical protein
VPANDAPTVEVEALRDAELPIDLDDFMEVEERSTPMGSKMPAAPEAEASTREALEARLVYETRAIGERRRALAGREWDRATRRVEPLADLKSTLTGLIAPPTPEEMASDSHMAAPIDPAPVWIAPPAGPDADAVPIARAEPPMVAPALAPSSRDTRSTLAIRIRAIRIRSAVVRSIGILIFVAMVVGFGLLLRAHDPGLVRTWAAIVGFFRTLVR